MAAMKTLALLATLGTAVAPPPAPRSSPAVVAGPDAVTARHLLARAGSAWLYGYADTDAQFAEARDYWTRALSAAGIAVTGAELKDRAYTISYATPDGRVIRDFMADHRQFAPKDDAALRANMAELESALRRAGLTPVHRQVIDTEFMLPTSALFYLAKPADKPEREVRLRLLNGRDDFDASVFAAAGVSVVQTPKPWLMAYVGPEAGYVTLIAKTREDLDKKLAERRAFLREQGRTVIAQRDVPVDFEDYRFGAGLYFLAR